MSGSKENEIIQNNKKFNSRTKMKDPNKSNYLMLVFKSLARSNFELMINFA